MSQRDLSSICQKRGTFSDIRICMSHRDLSSICQIRPIQCDVATSPKRVTRFLTFGSACHKETHLRYVKRPIFVMSHIKERYSM